MADGFTEFRIEGPMAYLKKSLIDSEVRGLLSRLEDSNIRVLDEREMANLLQLLALNVLEKYSTFVESELRMIRADYDRRSAVGEVDFNGRHWTYRP